MSAFSQNNWALSVRVSSAGLNNLVEAARKVEAVTRNLAALTPALEKTVASVSQLSKRGQIGQVAIQVATLRSEVSRAYSDIHKAENKIAKLTNRVAQLERQSVGAAAPRGPTSTAFRVPQGAKTGTTNLGAVLTTTVTKPITDAIANQTQQILQALDRIRQSNLEAIRASRIYRPPNAGAAPRPESAPRSEEAFHFTRAGYSTAPPPVLARRSIVVEARRVPRPAAPSRGPFYMGPRQPAGYLPYYPETAPPAPVTALAEPRFSRSGRLSKEARLARLGRVDADLFNRLKQLAAAEEERQAMEMEAARNAKLVRMASGAAPPRRSSRNYQGIFSQQLLSNAFPQAVNAFYAGGASGPHHAVDAAGQINTRAARAQRRWITSGGPSMFDMEIARQFAPGSGNIPTTDNVWRAIKQLSNQFNQLNRAMGGRRIQGAALEELRGRVSKVTAAGNTVPSDVVKSYASNLRRAVSEYGGDRTAAQAQVRTANNTGQMVEMMRAARAVSVPRSGSVADSLPSMRAAVNAHKAAVKQAEAAQEAALYDVIDERTQKILHTNLSLSKASEMMGGNEALALRPASGVMQARPAWMSRETWRSKTPAERDAIENTEDAKRRNPMNRLADAGGRAFYYGAAATAIYGGTAAAAASLKFMADFEEQMNKVERVMNPLGASSQKLGQEARKMGQEYGTSALEVAKAMEIFAAQGLSQAEVINRTRVAVLAANVTTLDMVEATEALTAASKQFKMPGTDFMRILDSWNEVENTTAVNAQTMTKAIMVAGTTARLAGFSFDETNGVIAAMGEATRKSGQALGTAVKFIFQNLRQDEAVKSLQSVGIYTQDAEGHLLSVKNVLATLHDRWNGLTEAQRQNVAISIAGTRHANDFFVLMERWPRALDISVTSLTAQGSAIRENEKTMESFNKKAAQLAAQWQNFLLQLSDSGALDMMKGLLGYASQLLGVFTKLNGLGGHGLGALSGLAIGGATLAGTFGLPHIMGAAAYEQMSVPTAGGAAAGSRVGVERGLSGGGVRPMIIEEQTRGGGGRGLAIGVGLAGLTLGNTIRSSFEAAHPEAEGYHPGRKYADIAGSAVSNAGLAAMFYKPGGPQGGGFKAMLALAALATASDIYSSFSKDKQQASPEYARQKAMERDGALLAQIGDGLSDLQDTLKEISSGRTIDPTVVGQLVDRLKSVSPEFAKMADSGEDLVSVLRRGGPLLEKAASDLRGSRTGAIGSTLTVLSASEEAAITKRDSLTQELSRKSGTPEGFRIYAELQNARADLAGVTNRFRGMSIAAGQSGLGARAILEGGVISNVSRATGAGRSDLLKLALESIVTGKGNREISAEKLLGGNDVERALREGFIQFSESGPILRLYDLQEVAKTKDEISEMAGRIESAGGILLKAGESIKGIPLMRPESLGKLVTNYVQSVNQLGRRNQELIENSTFVSRLQSIGSGAIDGGEAATGQGLQNALRMAMTNLSIERNGVSSVSNVDVPDTSPGAAIRRMQAAAGDILRASSAPGGAALTGLQSMTGEMQRQMSLVRSDALSTLQGYLRSGGVAGTLDRHDEETGIQFSSFRDQVEQYAKDRFPEIQQLVESYGAARQNGQTDLAERYRQKAESSFLEVVGADYRNAVNRSGEISRERIEQIVASATEATGALGQRYAYLNATGRSGSADQFLASPEAKELVATLAQLRDYMGTTAAGARRQLADAAGEEPLVLEGIRLNADLAAQAFDTLSQQLERLPDNVRNLDVGLRDLGDRMERAKAVAGLGGAFGLTGLNAQGFGIKSLERQLAQIQGDRSLDPKLMATAVTQLRDAIRGLERERDTERDRRALLGQGLLQASATDNALRRLGLPTGGGVNDYLLTAQQQLAESVQNAISTALPRLGGDPNSVKSFLDQLTAVVGPVAGSLRDAGLRNDPEFRKAMLLASPSEQALGGHLLDLMGQGASAEDVFGMGPMRMAAQGNPLFSMIADRMLAADDPRQMMELQQRLVKAMGEDLPNAIQRLIEALNSPKSVAVPGLASGTMALAGTGAVDHRGRIRQDETPAVLHAGEIVLNRRQADALTRNRFARGTLPGLDVGSAQVALTDKEIAHVRMLELAWGRLKAKGGLVGIHQLPFDEIQIGSRSLNIGGLQPGDLQAMAASGVWSGQNYGEFFPGTVVASGGQLRYGQKPVITMGHVPAGMSTSRAANFMSGIMAEEVGHAMHTVLGADFGLGPEFSQSQADAGARLVNVVKSSTDPSVRHAMATVLAAYPEYETLVSTGTGRGVSTFGFYSEVAGKLSQSAMNTGRSLNPETKAVAQAVNMAGAAVHEGLTKGMAPAQARAAINFLNSALDAVAGDKTVTAAQRQFLDNQRAAYKAALEEPLVKASQRSGNYRQPRNAEAYSLADPQHNYIAQNKTRFERRLQRTLAAMGRPDAYDLASEPYMDPRRRPGAGIARASETLYSSELPPDPLTYDLAEPLKGTQPYDLNPRGPEMRMARPDVYDTRWPGTSRAMRGTGEIPMMPAERGYAPAQALHRAPAPNLATQYYDMYGSRPRVMHGTQDVVTERGTTSRARLYENAEAQRRINAARSLPYDVNYTIGDTYPINDPNWTYGRPNAGATAAVPPADPVAGPNWWARFRSRGGSLLGKAWEKTPGKGLLLPAIALYYASKAGRHYLGDKFADNLMDPSVGLVGRFLTGRSLQAGQGLGLGLGGALEAGEGRLASWATRLGQRTGGFAQIFGRTAGAGTEGILGGLGKLMGKGAAITSRVAGSGVVRGAGTLLNTGALGLDAAAQAVNLGFKGLVMAGAMDEDNALNESSTMISTATSSAWRAPLMLGKAAVFRDSSELTAAGLRGTAAYDQIRSGVNDNTQWQDNVANAIEAYTTRITYFYGGTRASVENARMAMAQAARDAQASSSSATWDLPLALLAGPDEIGKRFTGGASGPAGPDANGQLDEMSRIINRRQAWITTYAKDLGQGAGPNGADRSAYTDAVRSLEVLKQRRDELQMAVNAGPEALATYTFLDSLSRSDPGAMDQLVRLGGNRAMDRLAGAFGRDLPTGAMSKVATIASSLGPHATAGQLAEAVFGRDAAEILKNRLSTQTGAWTGEAQDMIARNTGNYIGSTLGGSMEGQLAAAASRVKARGSASDMDGAWIDALGEHFNTRDSFVAMIEELRASSPVADLTARRDAIIGAMDQLLAFTDTTATPTISWADAMAGGSARGALAALAGQFDSGFGPVQSNAQALAASWSQAAEAIQSVYKNYESIPEGLRGDVLIKAGMDPEAKITSGYDLLGERLPDLNRINAYMNLLTQWRQQIGTNLSVWERADAARQAAKDAEAKLPNRASAKTPKTEEERKLYAQWQAAQAAGASAQGGDVAKRLLQMYNAQTAYFEARVATRGTQAFAVGSMALAGKSGSVDSYGRIREDETPALLHAGEVVLNRRQASAFLKNRFAAGTIDDEIERNLARREQQRLATIAAMSPERQDAYRRAQAKLSDESAAAGSHILTRSPSRPLIAVPTATAGAAPAALTYREQIQGVGAAGAQALNNSAAPDSLNDAMREFVDLIKSGQIKVNHQIEGSVALTADASLTALLENIQSLLQAQVGGGGKPPVAGDIIPNATAAGRGNG